MNLNFKAEDYTSFTLLARKDGSYSFQIMKYIDGEKHPKKSKPLIIKDYKIIHTLIDILNYGLELKRNKFDTDSFMDDLNKPEEPLETTDGSEDESGSKTRSGSDGSENKDGW